MVAGAEGWFSVGRLGIDIYRNFVFCFCAKLKFSLKFSDNSLCLCSSTPQEGNQVFYIHYQPTFLKGYVHNQPCVMSQRVVQAHPSWWHNLYSGVGSVLWDYLVLFCFVFSLHVQTCKGPTKQHRNPKEGGCKQGAKEFPWIFDGSVMLLSSLALKKIKIWKWASNYWTSRPTHSMLRLVPSAKEQLTTLS